MAAVENDRALAGNVTNRTAHPIDEDTLNDRDPSEIDDRLHVYGRLLAGQRKEPPRSIAGKLEAHLRLRSPSHRPPCLLWPYPPRRGVLLPKEQRNNG